MIKTFNPIPEEIRETHNVYFGIPELVIKKTKIIDDIICRYFNIPQSALRLKARNWELSIPRFLAMYMYYTYTNLSSTKIGLLLGGFRSGSVTSALRRVQNNAKHDSEFNDIKTDISNRIEAKLRNTELVWIDRERLENQ